VHACLDDLVIALYVTIDELLEPRRGPGHHPGCRTPNSSAWPSPRSCSATTPSVAGCGRSPTGWGTCSPPSAAKPPTTAGCAAPHHWSANCCAPWRSPARRGVTSGGCWTPPRSLRRQPPDGQAQPAGRLGWLRRRRQPSPLLLGPQAAPAGLPGRDADRLVPGHPQPGRAGGGRGAAGPRRPPGRAAPRPGHLGRQGVAGREFDGVVDELDALLVRPDRADEPYRFGSLGGVRQWVEAIIDALKDQLGWNATAPIPSKGCGSGWRSGWRPWPRWSGSTGSSAPRSSVPWSPTTTEPTNQSTSVI
jgi:hypothetical protein